MLVNCDYKGSWTLNELEGTKEDGKEMIKTFKDELGYNVIHLENEEATESAVYTTLWQLSRYLKRYSAARVNKKALIFAFSGHGGSGDTLCFQDGGKLYLSDILQCFVENRGVFAIPKLFFIDACRGNTSLTKGLAKTIESTVESATKGLSHEEGNFLIAYATIPAHVSYDKYWMYNLAMRIRENWNEPLTTVLQDLSRDMDLGQQSETLTRLRGHFKFEK